MTKQTAPTSASYWIGNPETLRLSRKFHTHHTKVASELAYIRGDYLDMTDAEVIETYENEHDS